MKVFPDSELIFIVVGNNSRYPRVVSRLQNFISRAFSLSINSNAVKYAS